MKLPAYVRPDTKTGLFEYCRPYPKDVTVIENGKQRKQYFRSLGTRDPRAVCEAVETIHQPAYYAIVKEARVLSRVSPEKRQEIIAFLQSSGVVGDGEMPDIGPGGMQMVVRHLLEYKARLIVAHGELNLPPAFSFILAKSIEYLNLWGLVEDTRAELWALGRKMRDECPPHLRKAMGLPFDESIRQHVPPRPEPGLETDYDPLDYVDSASRELVVADEDGGLSRLRWEGFNDESWQHFEDTWNADEDERLGIVAKHTAKKKHAALTIRDAFEKWKTLKERPYRTALAYEQHVRLFEEFFGLNFPIIKATPDHIRQLVRVWAEIPVGTPKHKRAGGGSYTIRELHDLAKSGQFIGRKRDAQTITKMPSALSSFFQALQSEPDPITIENPARSVAEYYNKQTHNTGRERAEYDAETLNRLFGSPMYTGAANDTNRRHIPGNVRTRDANYWLPLLALYTGARLEELGQLSVGDIRQHGAIHYISINNNDDTKRLKTVASRRFVPIHQTLIDAGFLAYHAERKAGGQQKLFPELAPLHARSKDKRHTKKFSQWFRRYCDHIGLSLSDSEASRIRRDFHSFRHTFKTACRQVRPENRSLHDYLTGHAPAANTGSVYGTHNPPSFEEANEYLQRITYPGFNFKTE